MIIIFILNVGFEDLFPKFVFNLITIFVCLTIGYLVDRNYMYENIMKNNLSKITNSKDYKIWVVRHKND